MARCRGFKTLNEAVNPEYHREWGHPVSVKDSIDYCIMLIKQKLYRRVNKHGRIHLILPEFKGKPCIVEHIFVSLSKIVSELPVEIQLGDEKISRGDIVVKFVPFTIQRPRLSIPVGWEDDLPQWTWNDVIKNGQYYSTSSSETWPRPEYKFYAQREMLAQLASERRARSSQ